MMSSSSPASTRTSSASRDDHSTAKGGAARSASKLLVGQLTIREASAPFITHAPTLGTLAAGSLVLLPSLWLLMRTFKGERALAVFDEGGPAG